MPSSKYLRSVVDFLNRQGWETSTTNIRDGVYIVAGKKSGANSPSSMLTMIVTEPEAEVTTDHVKYLLKTGREKNVDKVMLAPTVEVSANAKQAVNNYSVEILSTDTVSGMSGGGLEANTDSISMPDPDNSSEADADSGGRSFVTRRRLIIGGVIIIGGGILFSGGEDSADDPDVDSGIVFEGSLSELRNWQVDVVEGQEVTVEATDISGGERLQFQVGDGTAFVHSYQFYSEDSGTSNSYVFESDGQHQLQLHAERHEAPMNEDVSISAMMEINTQ
jgi:hypothetical protein